MDFCRAALKRWCTLHKVRSWAAPCLYGFKEMTLQFDTITELIWNVPSFKIISKK
jgi:hypothetical protein